MNPVAPALGELRSAAVHECLKTRWTGPVIVSFAQNGEDVRLWRVFAGLPRGFYVDVGAGDPVAGSVTKLFYDAGWQGINVEPGPKFSLLETLRSRDVNLEVAISSTEGDRTLWVSPADPELSSFSRVESSVLPSSASQAPTSVPARRLDEVLEEHTAGRHVDFLTIDVEGAERDVLESFDLRVVRPTVLVVEAVSPLTFEPSHAQWEPRVLAAGYVLAAFDGVNRFYVPEERRDLAAALAYPVSALDRYVLHQTVEATRAAEELERTFSWRITRPLRSARRLQRSLRKKPQAPLSAPAPSDDRRD